MPETNTDRCGLVSYDVTHFELRYRNRNRSTSLFCSLHLDEFTISGINIKI
jgi:hypothetical protein